MRANLCGLSVLKIFPDCATFIEKPGDIEVNAVSPDCVSTLFESLKFAISVVEEHYGRAKIQEGEPDKQKKNEKLPCSVLPKKELEEGYEVVFGDKVLEERDRGDGVMEEHRTSSYAVRKEGT